MSLLSYCSHSSTTDLVCYLHSGSENKIPSFSLSQLILTAAKIFVYSFFFSLQTPIKLSLSFPWVHLLIFKLFKIYASKNLKKWGWQSWEQLSNLGLCFRLYSHPSSYNALGCLMTVTYMYSSHTPSEQYAPGNPRLLIAYMSLSEQWNCFSSSNKKVGFCSIALFFWLGRRKSCMN